MKGTTLSAIAGLAVLALAGCGPQYVVPNATPTMTFEVPMTYQEAFQRARTYAFACYQNHRGRARGGYVNAELHTDTRSAEIHVSGALIAGPEWQRMRIVAKESGSEIMIADRDRGKFARQSMGAAVTSIVTGKTVCSWQIAKDWQPDDAPVPLVLTGELLKP